MKDRKKEKDLHHRLQKGTIRGIQTFKWLQFIKFKNVFCLSNIYVGHDKAWL